jgi:hypothetical protein
LWERGKNGIKLNSKIDTSTNKIPQNDIIFIHDIMNKNRRVIITCAVIKNMWEYLLNPNVQPTDCSTTTKMKAGGKGRR